MVTWPQKVEVVAPKYLRLHISVTMPRYTYGYNWPPIWNRILRVKWSPDGWRHETPKNESRSRYSAAVGSTERISSLWCYQILSITSFFPSHCEWELNLSSFGSSQFPFSLSDECCMNCTCSCIDPWFVMLFVVCLRNISGCGVCLCHQAV